jgi:hypothetical protein
VAAGFTVCVPLVGFGPVHSMQPLAVQLATFVLLQVSVLLCPAEIVSGLALNVSVGVVDVRLTVNVTLTSVPATLV